MEPQGKIKAVFFDFMGTCLNWHKTAVEAMPSSFPHKAVSKFVLNWRQQYFNENSLRIQQGQPPEDIDMTLRRALEAVLDRFPEHKAHLDEGAKRNLLEKWHSQSAWPDVAKAVRTLREDMGLDVCVHANGTTRLQMDLCRSSGLQFDMLFSSLLLGVYKPDVRAYEKGLELVKLRPDQVVMVAAHAYDLRGAQKCGMKTVYIHRWTDDIEEDMEKVKTEFDMFLEDMEELPAVIGRMSV
jgi:2-haloalkanoic acid dehalogenase type II